MHRVAMGQLAAVSAHIGLLWPNNGEKDLVRRFLWRDVEASEPLQ